MRCTRGEIEILAAPLGIEIQSDGDGFQQRRFTRAVFADEKSDVAMEFDFIERSDGGEIEWVDIKRRNLISREKDGGEEGMALRRSHWISRGGLFESPLFIATRLVEPMSIMPESVLSLGAS